ncbi:protein containing DUF820 [Candidatus Thiomargarita nelsonii]|uniref:Protein containing DUF820 n=1 Tax=Candidatus Thiomargarita nelsonii TaxID=1003181 RepID=A0A176RSH2_9GAMM|nr:protein containing DUF820 [Candidatus Thiomargarita nelsonii]
MALIPKGGRNGEPPSVQFTTQRETIKVTANILQNEGSYYPDTDGKPIAESDFHRDPLFYLTEALNAHFREQAEVYVSGALMLYYEEGNPNVFVAPDVFVVFGIPKHNRRIYQTWIEGKGPDVVIEITSHLTRQEDEEEKHTLYQRLGVQEFFMYDPTSDYLQPPLRGQWLVEGTYQEMTTTQLTDGTLILPSCLLGLQLRLENDLLRLFDPKNGEYLLTYSELVQSREKSLGPMT